VKIDLNMLRALVLNWIAGHVDDADIVTENHCSPAERHVKLLKKLTKPGDLNHYIGDNTILSLSAGAGDYRLALGGPGDEVGTEEHSVSRRGSAGVRAASQISILVDHQILDTGWAQVKAQMQSTPYVVKNAL
jgi:hypothetical protein